MASSLRHAARRFCGRAFQRPLQREEQRRLFPSISHGGGSLRRFSSSESPKLVNNNMHVLSSATEPTSPPPLWSPRNPMFLPFALGYAFLLCGGCYATIYLQTLLRGGPVVWKEPDDSPLVWEQPDDIRKKGNE